jgi:UrcA family protein
MTRLLAGFAGAATALSFALAASAHAADLRLAFGDLDLSQPGQAKVLDTRIEKAAQAFCAGEIQTGTRITTGCVIAARETLMQALPASTLAAYKAGMKAPVR